jgi:hypothetical protein
MTLSLNLNLSDILEAKYPQGFTVPADIDISSFLEFADDDWDHRIDLDAHFEGDCVILVWSLEDVWERRSDLTKEQAWKVLIAARDAFQRDQSQRDFLESTALEMFPIGPQATEQLRQRLLGLVKKVESLPNDGISKAVTFAAIAKQIEELDHTLEQDGS